MTHVFVYLELNGGSFYLIFTSIGVPPNLPLSNRITPFKFYICIYDLNSQQPNIYLSLIILYQIFTHNFSISRKLIPKKKEHIIKNSFEMYFRKY